MGITDSETLQLIFLALNVVVFALGFVGGQQR